MTDQTCSRCKGTAIDPEHSGVEHYGDGIVRPVPEPCSACQMQPTPADELRQAADTLSPATDTAPTLTGEYPDLDACYAHMLRSAADTYDAATKGRPGAVDESAYWLAPALAAARRINSAPRVTVHITGTPEQLRAAGEQVGRALRRTRFGEVG